MTLDFYEEVARLLRAGGTLAIVTLVDRQGSTPRRFGAKMVVTESGETAFSIGGGAFEALVIEDAREAMRQGRGLEKEYRFTEQGENAVGMVCGGTARVLIEVVRAPLPLIVFGGGHVGREVAHLGVRLGFDVTVIDDRPRYLDPDRYPEGVRRVQAEHDFAYVGVIGSRRKVATLLARAEALGISRDALAHLHAPIGVPIGAETPEEIAVSIAAEMIGVRNASARAHRASDRPTPAAVTPFGRGRAPSRSI